MCAAADRRRCCGALRAQLRSGWSLCTGLLLDDGGVYEAAGSGDLRLMTWHVAAAGRRLVENGLIDYLPVRASQLEKCIATWDLDAALVRVTPPDADGWCSVGPSAGFAHTAIKTAKLCIAEVDEALPRTFGQSRVHLSALDVMVPSTTPTPSYGSPEPDAVNRAIARHVLSLLPERPVLQLGIGGVTEALVAALGKRVSTGCGSSAWAPTPWSTSPSAVCSISHAAEVRQSNRRISLGHNG